ncbi:MAG TPA: DUF5683 domain-containing protein, partial [Prolixibacteraceae bacterium]|nr:DUF5683 domain-containing protein [Prolixibacteraceae bacterium]
VKGQIVDDSVIVKKSEEVHSQRKATIYSAALPGLGQIYNSKYWKVPIVYGGIATLGYFINFNHERYIKYRQAYSDIIDEDPNTNSHFLLITNYDTDRKSQYTERLGSYKDYWRRNRDLLVIGTAVFYALNIIDASVDAHFFNFDISEDLTMKWAPGPVMCVNDKAMGIHCSITF